MNCRPKMRPLLVGGAEFLRLANPNYSEHSERLEKVARRRLAESTSLRYNDDGHNSSTQRQVAFGAARTRKPSAVSRRLASLQRSSAKFLLSTGRKWSQHRDTKWARRDRLRRGGGRPTASKSRRAELDSGHLSWTRVGVARTNAQAN